VLRVSAERLVSAPSENTGYLPLSSYAQKNYGSKVVQVREDKRHLHLGHLADVFFQRSKITSGLATYILQ
jgi:hypothetical protein